LSDYVIDITFSPFGRWGIGGRYNEQIVTDWNSVAQTAITCKDELISTVCVHSAMEFLISIAAPP